MKTIHAYTKIGLLLLGAALFTVASARADTYSWTNFQSDIPGVAQHVDPNLVNPWGMAVSSGGVIWVSNNGTGTSTLYQQDGTALTLVVEIPRAARNRDVANPTGIVFNSTSFFQVTKNGNSAPLVSSSLVKTVRSQAGTRRWTKRTRSLPLITVRTTALTVPYTKAQRSESRTVTISCMRQIFIPARFTPSMKTFSR